MLFLPPPKHFVWERGLLRMQVGSMQRPAWFVVWDDEYEETVRLVQSLGRIGMVCLRTHQISISPFIRRADVGHLARIEPVAILTAQESKIFNGLVTRLGDDRRFYGDFYD